MSPRSGPRSGPEVAAGKERTLVALSLPRNRRFKAWIWSSLVKTRESSASAAKLAPACTTAARTARLAGLGRFARLGQPPASRRRSSRGCRFALSAPGVRFGAAIIGLHDARDERMADDVGGGKPDLGDAFDAAHQRGCLDQPRDDAVRQVDLARIAGDDHLRVLAEAGEKHLHLHRGGILRLVEDD